MDTTTEANMIGYKPTGNGYLEKTYQNGKPIIKTTNYFHLNSFLIQQLTI